MEKADNLSGVWETKGSSLLSPNSWQKSFMGFFSVHLSLTRPENQWNYSPLLGGNHKQVSKKLDSMTFFQRPHSGNSAPFYFVIVEKEKKMSKGEKRQAFLEHRGAPEFSSQ